MPTTTQPLAAYCEDIDDETNSPLPETRKVANVAAKRSGHELMRIKSNHDGASDSGYSSHTVATMHSGSPGPAGKLKTVKTPLRLDTKLAEHQKRPSIAERRSDNRQRASGKQGNLVRTTSQMKRVDRMNRMDGLNGINGMNGMNEVNDEESTSASSSSSESEYEECNCSECIAAANGSASHVRDDRRSKDKSQYEVALSPVSTAYPAVPYQELQIDQPQQHFRPRAQSSSSYNNPRPASFHGGMMPSNMMMPWSPYNAPVVEHGPPLSASAYANMVPNYPPPAYPASAYPYGALPIQRPQGVQDAPPYEQPPRAQPRQWTGEYPPRPRGGGMMYNAAPVIQYDKRNYPQAKPSTRSNSSSRSRARAPSADTPDHEHGADYYRMPPPPQPRQVVLPRPPAQKFRTNTSASQKKAEHADAPTQQPRREEYAVEPRRRRPSLAIHGPNMNKQRPATSYVVPESPKLAIESNRGRRSSYYGHEPRQETEQRSKEMAVEEYQLAKGTRGQPLTVDALRAQHHSSHGSQRRGSESRSRTSSSREGSDARTRVSTVSAATKTDTDSITMRFNPITGTVDVTGDSTGLGTISFKPKDGGMELTIGGREGKRYNRDDTIVRRVQELQIEDRPNRDDGSDRRSRRSSRSLARLPAS